MDTVGRRRFLALLGAGVVVVAGGGILVVRQLNAGGLGNTLSFQAIARLPAAPLPTYASYVIDGQINLDNHSGPLTITVFAGPPEARTSIALLKRQVRVTSVQRQGSTWSIAGVMDGQLQAGEQTGFALLLDPARRRAHSTFFGSPIQLALANFSAAHA